MRLDADGNPDKGQPVISGLDDPSGLAIDASGNFYISDGGASQQVKVFTPAGKPLREIGIKGGRPRDGIYNPAGMLDPHGLCVAPDGKVWVAELADDYQILGAWNPDGTRAKSYYNTHWASGQGCFHRTERRCCSARGTGSSNAGLTSYKFDMKNGTWAPYWHLSMAPEAMDQKDVLLGWDPSNAREQAMFDHHMPYLSFEKDMVQGTNG